MGKNYMCDFYFALADQESYKAFSILKDLSAQAALDKINSLRYADKYANSGK